MGKTPPETPRAAVRTSRVQSEAVSVSGTRSRGKRDGVMVASPAGSWRPVEAELISVSGFYDRASVLICGVIHRCRLSDSRDGLSSPPILDLSLASGARECDLSFPLEPQTAKTEDTVNSTQTTSEQILTPYILVNC